MSRNHFVVINTMVLNNESNLSDAILFPCIEQPLRVTLHCNGYYLWGLRKGRVIVRKRRSEKDEFRLSYGDAGVVTIQNHKFGGHLSVVQDAKGVQKTRCVKDVEEETEAQDEEEKAEEVNNDEEMVDTTTRTGLPKSDEDDNEDENDSEDEDDNEEMSIAASISLEDRQWCFIKGADENDGVMLKSLKTGENLGLDASGNLVFASDFTHGTIAILWRIECVTGELCFLSNPLLNQRIRCDLAGLATLSQNWKGWEVFRFMEANHGYVKIASWMHSQWLLCSTVEGTVTTCSHADSLLEENSKGICSKWAIEKSTSGNGVIIRSKTHGRLLSVKEGSLKTYHHNDDDENLPITNAGNQQAISEHGDASGSKAGGETTASTQTQVPPFSQGDHAAAAAMPSKSNWWSNRRERMQHDMKGMQETFSSSRSNTNDGDVRKKSIESNDQWWNKSVKRMQGSFNSGETIVVPERETIIWQLEAAHLQTYYFTNVVEGEKSKSIGPFPEVTSNLRKTDKFQLVRHGTITKLCNFDKQQYVACSSDGTISYVDDGQDENTEWTMDNASHQESGSVFKSKLHTLYLSYRYNDTGKEAKEDSVLNLFNIKLEAVAELFGSEKMEVWNLAPSMPRAVSSEKIKTFAIGTSIAVGTTIAMPFALAGMGALLGAVGAQAGIVANTIAVGLTGAEAIASVGAIGATAYIVFRPEDNALTDDHQNDDEEEIEQAWSKRPFGNWRNW